VSKFETAVVLALLIALGGENMHFASMGKRPAYLRSVQGLQTECNSRWSSETLACTFQELQPKALLRVGGTEL
jgi:hypothetical protein